jgi:hypothetical protein
LALDALQSFSLALETVAVSTQRLVIHGIVIGVVTVSMIHIQLAQILRNKATAFTDGANGLPIGRTSTTCSTASRLFCPWAGPDLPFLVTAKTYGATGHTGPRAVLDVLSQDMVLPVLSHVPIITKARRWGGLRCSFLSAD